MFAENLTGPVAVHAEGPVWSPAWGGIRWVDGYAGELLTLRADGVHRLAVGSRYAAFVRPRSGGGYVVATEHGLALADGPDEAPDHAVELLDDPAVRLNDGATDPFGRLYAGSMAYGATPGAGRLFRVSPDADESLAVDTVLDSVTVSNGLAFSPDGSLAYYADTPTGRIDVFDHDGGELVRRRPFVRFEPGAGRPDGLTVASDGSVWVAVWGGHAVHGYSTEGVLQERIELPVRQVSACTFGGDDLATLYITTSAERLDPAHAGEAGSLFAARPGVAGLPVVPFAG